MKFFERQSWWLMMIFMAGWILVFYVIILTVMPPEMCLLSYFGPVILLFNYSMVGILTSGLDATRFEWKRGIYGLIKKRIPTKTITLASFSKADTSLFQLKGFSQTPNRLPSAG